jgi:hypothetical protein
MRPEVAHMNAKTAGALCLMWMVSGLTACGPGSSARWTFGSDYGDRVVEGATAVVEDADGAERIALRYATEGAPLLADDEVVAEVLVELTALPEAPRSVPIRGTIVYEQRFAAGGAWPPDLDGWSFLRAEGNDPIVERVLVYWGGFREAFPRYEAEVTGILELETIDAAHVSGTLHLDATGNIPYGYNSGEHTLDAAFTASR